MKRLAIVSSLLLIVSSVSAQLVPKPAPDARSAVVGDINGDGLTDVIDDYTVQLNTGGALAAPVRLPVTGRILDVLDVNGDGAADLLTTGDAIYSMPPQGPYFLYLNDGHGNFTKLPAPSAVNPPAVNGAVILPPLIADFDGDGKDDFILPYLHGFLDPAHDFRFLRSRGDGSFEETAFITVNTRETVLLGMQGRQHMPVGDITGDGKPDVILKTSASLIILASRGDGKFEPLPERFTSGKYGWGNGMHVVDVDGDGKNDLAWVDVGRATVFFGDGRGGFPRMATARVGDPTAPISMAVGETLAPIHFSSAQRYDVAVGAPGSLVVVVSYANGALREVARTKLFEAVPLESPYPPYVWYRDVNVFAGKFRTGSTTDLYAFNSWDQPTPQPAFLLFQEKPANDTLPPRRRASGKPGTAPAPAFADRFTLHVVPGYVDLITGRCYGQEETLSFQRDGIFATGTRSNGARVDAVIESDDVIHVGHLQSDRFNGGTFTRVAPGHYTGHESWQTSCGGEYFPIDLDGYLVP